ncbi:MAG: hypothetical protein A2005_09715 [Desulfuromonadales bacterium GWC2_61_20]|nr:MAG: hypothetical protein A2005_09715 [Desulfuromonadales bacterium GWC2_61_20]
MASLTPVLDQNPGGYRYSLDPFLLVGFAAAESGRRLVDLGCGSGVVPLLLAARRPQALVSGIELQPRLAELARSNVAASGVADRVEIIAGDLRQIGPLLPPAECDAVLANPPYRRVGSGRLAPDGERAAARHELNGTLADFVAAAVYLLKAGGRFYLVHLPERLSEVLTLLQTAGLAPKRLRCVHPQPGAAACLVLVEGRKGGRPGLVVETPLLVRDGGGYSPEMAALYASCAGGSP